MCMIVWAYVLASLWMCMCSSVFVGECVFFVYKGTRGERIVIAKWAYSERIVIAEWVSVSSVSAASVNNVEKVRWVEVGNYKESM